ncbi:hypothetical protein L3Q82_016377 [Scortum barcoo]|uniref:Uncharacterized protein n=1 Tax=Scortum barcoo TaxID=214431 RepID=A0ACB8X7J8_9TELE|nr:hypothetical protein L3Q82_016377 [Scortum barcoo]
MPQGRGWGLPPGSGWLGWWWAGGWQLAAVGVVSRIAAGDGCAQNFMERHEGVGFRRVMDTMRHAHSLESLEMIGWDIDRGGVHSQDTDHLLTHPIRGRERAGLVLRSGPPSPTHKEAISIRLLDSKGPIEALGFDSTPPPPSPRPRSIPPPLRLDVDAAGRSVLRLSHSQPSSPPAGPYHPALTPIQTPAVFSLDQTMFNLPGDAR